MPPLPSTFDYRPPTEPWLDIVYEDDRLILCNKPSGLLTVPGKDPSLADCLEARVQARYPQYPAAKVVHRLDKDTSGLLLLAFDKAALGALGSQFEHRKV
jgi:tRNA pseudouridine32 synthase/23S rRNA pseudouridine746 synthase